MASAKTYKCSRCGQDVPSGQPCEYCANEKRPVPRTMVTLKIKEGVGCFIRSTKDAAASDLPVGALIEFEVPGFDFSSEFINEVEKAVGAEFVDAAMAEVVKFSSLKVLKGMLR